MPNTEKNCLIGLTMPESNRETCESGNTFSFDHDTSVEVILIKNEPYFVAADVCRALGLVNPTDHIVKSLDDDEHLTYKIYRAGQNRLVNMISESGLYALVVRSTKPNAKKFRKWVTSEVLPSIRKTGTYQVKKRSPRRNIEAEQWKQKYEQLRISGENHVMAFDTLMECYEMVREERNKLRDEVESLHRFKMQAMDLVMKQI